MVTLWSQVKFIQSDERYIALVNDSEIRESLRSENLMSLLNSSKAEELVKLVTSVELPQKAKASIETMNSNMKGSIETQSEKIIRWVDENGKIHYSDKKIIDVISLHFHVSRV